MVRGFVVLYAIGMAYQVVSTGVIWGLARVVGARVTEIKLGFPAIQIRGADPKILVGPLPGASLGLFGRGVDAELSSDPQHWRQLGLAARFGVMLAPTVLLVALGVGCLGHGRAFASFGHAFGQLLVTLDLTPLLRRLLALAATGAWSIVVGILAIKTAAMSLVPIGGSSGGGLVQELFQTRARRSPRWLDIYMIATMGMAMLWFLGRFGWAVIGVLRG